MGTGNTRNSPARQKKRFMIWLILLVAMPVFGGIQDVLKRYDAKDYAGTIEAAKAVINDSQSTIEEKAQAQLYLAHSVSQLQGAKQAIPEYLKILETYPSSRTQCAYAIYTLFSCYYSAGDYNQAIMLLTKGVNDYPDCPMAASMVWYIPLCHANKKDYEKALAYTLGSDSIHLLLPSAAGPVAQAGNGPLQKIIALWSIQADRPDALLQAKLYYDTCSLDQIQDALDMVCAVLKGQDFNLKRVNQFIQYQKDGTGENPLAGLQVPAERRAYLDRLTSKCDSTYSGQRTAMYLLLMAGKPKEALQRAKKAYSLAPMKDINQAIMDIAVCLKAIDGNIIRANQFIESQRKGEPFQLP